MLTLLLACGFWQSGASRCVVRVVDEFFLSDAPDGATTETQQEPIYDLLIYV